MVGLVVVSHSARLADGVVELAAQMAGPDVRIGAAGGLDEPGGALGTDAAMVLRAIDEVWSEDGVLVLMDLGSAVLSAELALDLLDGGTPRGGAAHRGAAGRGRGGGGGGRRPGRARSTLWPRRLAAAWRPRPRSCRRGGEAAAARRPRPRRAAEIAGGGDEAAGGRSRPSGSRSSNPLGLHARPAALLVRTAAGFDARVAVTDVTTGRGPVSARSLSGVATLGARRGDELALEASGPQAAEALAAIGRLADDGFGEARGDGQSRDRRSGGGSRARRPSRASSDAAAPGCAGGRHGA